MGFFKNLFNDIKSSGTPIGNFKNKVIEFINFCIAHSNGISELSTEVGNNKANALLLELIELSQKLTPKSEFKIYNPENSKDDLLVNVENIIPAVKVIYNELLNNQLVNLNSLPLALKIKSSLIELSVQSESIKFLENHKKWESHLIGLEMLRLKSNLMDEGYEMPELINKLLIPYEISFQKVCENQLILDETSYSDLIPENIGSKSIIFLRTRKSIYELPKNYNILFLAAFPDVYKFLTDNINKDNELVNINKKFISSPNLYVNKHGRFNYVAYKVLCEFYLSRMHKFETQCDSYF